VALRAVVIGVGSALRGDDAVGLLVVRRLAAEVAVLESDGDPAALLDAWRGAELAIVIDAARSGAPAGTIRRFDAAAEPLPARLSAGSTHGLGLAHAVELARALGALPPRLVVYAIEGGRFEAGAAPAPEVARAADDVARRILAELRAG
jgi:hydrogenase maturation protease